jgi:SAM-dependent methyltransferase
MEKTDWFTSWFNTPYYHILYKDRNDADAQLFMQNITQFLQLPKDTHILDLPCGKGRHSVYLNSLGYRVTGGDLSENSISYAKQFENDRLKFKIKDMRVPFRNQYDAVFNLFTSFGYFETDEDEIDVLRNMKQGLSNEGVLVLDFLNVVNVKNTLVEKEVKTVEGIDFHIERDIKDGFILKHISFTDKGKDHSYTERVKYLDLERFQSYFAAAGLTIQHLFGDYQLSDYNEQTSDRLILVAR